jgi:hypothetical protein
MKNEINFRLVVKHLLCTFVAADSWGDLANISLEITKRIPAKVRLIAVRYFYHSLIRNFKIVWRIHWRIHLILATHWTSFNSKDKICRLWVVFVVIYSYISLNFSLKTSFPNGELLVSFKTTGNYHMMYYKELYKFLILTFRTVLPSHWF